jgi:hypothetical protein
LEAEPEARDIYVAELRKECGEAHRLAGREFECFAKCDGCDRAVFALDHDEWALVHLTWRRTAETDPNWPSVEALGLWPDVLEAMHAHSQRYDDPQE